MDWGPCHFQAPAVPSDAGAQHPPKGAVLEPGCGRVPSALQCRGQQLHGLGQAHRRAGRGGAGLGVWEALEAARSSVGGGGSH